MFTMYTFFRTSLQFIFSTIFQRVLAKNSTEIAALQCCCLCCSCKHLKRMEKKLCICRLFCGCVMLERKCIQKSKERTKRKENSSHGYSKINAVLRSSLFWFCTTVSNKLNAYTRVSEWVRMWRGREEGRERKKGRKREYSFESLSFPCFIFHTLWM